MRGDCGETEFDDQPPRITRRRDGSSPTEHKQLNNPSHAMMSLFGKLFSSQGTKSKEVLASSAQNEPAEHVNGRESREMSIVIEEDEAIHGSEEGMGRNTDGGELQSSGKKVKAKKTPKPKAKKPITNRAKKSQKGPESAAPDSEDEEDNMDAALNPAAVEVVVVKSNKAKKAKGNSNRGSKGSKALAEDPLTHNMSTTEVASALNGPSKPLPKSKAWKSRSKQPLTPARHSDDDIGNDTFEAEEQLRRETESTAPEDPVEAEGSRPVKPSKKAFGKRKASDAASEGPRKRSRTKEKSVGTPPLSNFGFVSTPAGKRSTISSAMDLDMDAWSANLAKVAQSIYDEDVDRDESETPKIAKKPTLSKSMIPSRMSQARRPTPQFTPINAQRKLEVTSAKSQPPKSSRFEIVIMSPPTSHVGPQTVSKSKLPAAKTAPLETQTQEDLGFSDESEFEPASELEARPESDVESESELQPAQTKVRPKPNEKRKRRLPVDDEPLLKSDKVKTPRKSSSQAQAQPSTSSSRRPTVDPSSKQFKEAVKQDVEVYRLQNDLEQYDLNALIQGGDSDDARAFWRYIYTEYPDVTKAKLRNICRRAFHNYAARGTWSAEDEMLLQEMCEKFPNKWKQIGSLMNRMPEDCRDRWRNYLVCGDKQKRKEYWDAEEEDKLQSIVTEMIASLESLKELMKNRDARMAKQTAEELVDWKIVSERMGHTRSRLQCLEKWKMIKKRGELQGEAIAVTTDPISESWRLEDASKAARQMTTLQKLNMVYAIRDSGAGRYERVPWKIIKEKTNVEQMPLKVCLKNLVELVPGYEEMAFRDILESLVDVFEAAAPEEPPGFGIDYWEPVGPERTKRAVSRVSERVIHSDGSDEDVDNGEGSNTGPAKTTEKTRSKPKKQKNHAEALSETEAASAANRSKKRSHKKKIVNVREDSEPEAEVDENPEEVIAAPKKKKKKKSKSLPLPAVAVVSEDGEAADSAKASRKKTKKKTKSLSALENVVEPDLEDEPTSEKPKKKKSKSISALEDIAEADLAEPDLAEPDLGSEIDEPSTEKPKKKKKKKSALREDSVIDEPELPEGEHKSKKKRKASLSTADDIEVEKPKRKKHKSLSTPAVESDGSAQEGFAAPSTKHVKKPNATPFIDPTASISQFGEEAMIDSSTSKKKKKEKLSESMRKDGQSQGHSQETATDEAMLDIGEDLFNAFQGMKNGKKSARQQHGNPFMSAERVVESDSDEERDVADVLEEVQDDEDVDNGQAFEEELEFNSEDEIYTAPGGPDPISTASHTSADETEESVTGDIDNYDQGSVDLDAGEERMVTMNGFHQDDDEHGSVDLDTPRQSQEVEEELEISSEDSEDDIPAIPRRKGLAREISIEL